MSERVNKIWNDLSKILGNNFDRSNYAFEQMVALSRALKSEKTIQAICNERFDSFCDNLKTRLIPEDIVLESFKSLELQISATLSERHKEDKRPDIMGFTRQAIAYYNEILNFTGNKENVTLSFQWHTDDPKHVEDEITFLFKLLIGSNSAKINLLHPNVTLEHFTHLFSGKTWPTKIIWNYDLGALPYLIDRLFEALSIPENLENNVNKTEKQRRAYFNERIIACFVDKNGANLGKTQLTSLRSKFKPESKKGLLIDEIVVAFIHSQKAIR